MAEFRFIYRPQVLIYSFRGTIYHLAQFLRIGAFAKSPRDFISGREFSREKESQQPRMRFTRKFTKRNVAMNVLSQDDVKCANPCSILEGRDAINCCQSKEVKHWLLHAWMPGFPFCLGQLDAGRRYEEVVSAIYETDLTFLLLFRPASSPLLARKQLLQAINSRKFNRGKE